MTRHEALRLKILSDETLGRQLSVWKLQSKKIVFTNGCFDLIHPGHIDYLVKAADMGDVLIIGVNSDRSVRELKGTTRPINNEFSRCTVLAALGFVSAVIVFDEATPYNLIKKIQPDVLVKGGDWKPENIVGNDIVYAKGGVVASIDFLPGFSTSLIEKKIKEG